MPLTRPQKELCSHRRKNTNIIVRHVHYLRLWGTMEQSTAQRGVGISPLLILAWAIIIFVIFFILMLSTMRR